MRLDFEFVGTTSQKLSLDPAEFKGKVTPEITREIMGQLRAMAPGVSFFTDDVVLAADAIRAENDSASGTE